MKNIIKLQLLVFFIILIQVRIVAQTYTYNCNQVLPPSPTAASLGSYGDIPVSNYTGAANIGIPLFTINERDLSLNLSLNYNSQGVKVQQEASWVGLSWSLTSSRNVRQ